MKANQFFDISEDEFAALNTHNFNKAKIPKHILEAQQNDAESDFNDDGFDELMNSPPDHPSMFLTQANLPESVDWVAEGYVTSVKDQQYCGSCYTFASVGALESAYMISRSSTTEVDFSEQQLVDCSYGVGINSGCNGGDMPDCFEYLQTSFLMTEASYPYTSSHGNCAYNQASGVLKVNTYTNVYYHNDPWHLMENIATTPTTISICASKRPFQFYSSGILNTDRCGTCINHAVLATGYGYDFERDMAYFTIKNQWGTSWGDNGYMRLRRQPKYGKGVCGILRQTSYATLL